MINYRTNKVVTYILFFELFFKLFQHYKYNMVIDKMIEILQ